MSIVDKIRAHNGVVTFLTKFIVGDIPNNNRKSDEFINNILIRFFTDNNITSYSKNNRPGYKGNFNPLIANGPIIQEHWQEFKKWMHNNYKLRSNVEKD